MRPTAETRIPSEPSDAVGLVIALLVRYPQLATLVSHPNDRTLTLSFAVRARLGSDVVRALRDTIVEHVRALGSFSGETPTTIRIASETDGGVGFVRVTRDAATFVPQELGLLVALFTARFGDALVVSTTADEDALEDDDDLVAYTLDALRDPSQKRSLVGFREEKRVFVYFARDRKKKARPRA